MIIDKPGKVTDHILLLGRRESCVYLLNDGEESALIGGGMVHIVPDILKQLSDFGISEKKIQRIIILHSHFDHCGIVPFFKKRWPWATVTASERAKSILSSPKAIATIEKLNGMLISRYGREKEFEALGLSFPGVAVEEVVKDGTTLPCGDLTMEFMEVPGHSSCSIALYVPQEKALFASDAGGIPFGEGVFTAANSNFDKYIESLERISTYDMNVYLAAHYGARTGESVRNFLKASMASTGETRRLLEASYARTRDVKKSVEGITDSLMTKAPEDFIPRDVISLVVGQMVNHISKKWSAGHKGD